MKDLITEIVKALVDQPEEVSVNEIGSRWLSLCGKVKVCGVGSISSVGHITTRGNYKDKDVVTTW